jgi:hypothetical protein
LHQPAQHFVVRVVEALDAPFGIGEAQLPGVDVVAAGNDAGDRAKPDANPRRAGIDVARQGIREHRRVELVSFPVDVEISPRKTGREQRGTELRGGSEQLVDKAVLGLPQGQRIEPRRRDEIRRIFGAAMRRGEDERQPARSRLVHVENPGGGRPGQEFTIHITTLVRGGKVVIISA